MKKKGFTLIELLVAMSILVVAFGLVTFLYTKAARIRKIVVVNSEVQQTLSQIVDTLTYGDKTHWGMMHTTGLSDVDQYDTYIVLEKVTEAGTNTMVVNIESTGNITVNWGDGQITLNVGEKVALLTDPPYRSNFRYFDGKGNEIQQPITSSIEREKVTFIRITLWARSTDPSFKFAEPVPFVTGVRLGNKTSF